jgi:NADH oxidase (H2O2-forming)
VGVKGKEMRFVIVGNGIAGMSAAQAIRRFLKKANVTIVSEEPYPTYSPCVLPNYLTGEISREKLFVREFQDYSRENIQLITSERAIALDPKEKKVILESKTVAYDKLIVSTGSKPRIPPIRGTKRKGVFTFKSIEDGDSISRWKGHTAVVIGSGPIGVEVSLALKTRGYRVFLIEILDRILPQVFDDYPACLIEDALKSAGIEVGTEEKVTEILGEEKVQGVLTHRRKIACDTVVLATGMRPEKSFVEGIVDQGRLGGIRVSDRMATNLKDVYACGDCIETQSLVDGQPMLSLLWHNARQQGEVAGSNAAGFLKTYPGSLNITGVEVSGLHAISIGSIGAGPISGLEIIEVKRNEGHRRLILSKGVLVGVQSIDWGEDLGLFLAAIVRKEKVKTYHGLTSSRKPLLGSFPQFPFGRNLNRVPNKG